MLTGIYFQNLFTLFLLFIIQNMLRTPLLLFLVVLSTSIHIHHLSEDEISILEKQQFAFEARINKLLANITSIENKVGKTPEDDERIVILQQAIKAQRKEIFELSKVIIPPFNISKKSCEQMTDQQKVSILQQLVHAKKQVQDLKSLSKSLPECEETEEIKADVEKQIFFLDNIESIVKTKCEQNVKLSPTIFQTNIYAKGWILGSLTIHDLIEQYYQRSIKYNNITNCPFDEPFFTGKKCIVCPKQTPIFNIEDRKCVNCPEDTHLDNKLKSCEKDIHATNWTALKNYLPRQGPFPKTSSSYTACPQNTPYYDGSNCVACDLPKYWNITGSSCSDCENEKEFDENEGKCMVASKNFLTLISGTKWVTDSGNITQVLVNRVAILQKNETGGAYQYCPKSDPFFDGVACISCPEGKYFNIERKECQTPPEGTQYNANARKFKAPQKKKTNPQAQNLIGELESGQENVESCDSDTPFFDGQACIGCQKPFIYFDIKSKKCVQCSPETSYNKEKKSCQAREKIFVSTNTDSLMATPKTSLDGYEKKVKEKVDQNPDAIIVNCENQKDYSDFKSCFSCQQGQYFNVETMKCDKCDGKLEKDTSKCKNKLYLFVNPNASNIKNFPFTSQEYKKYLKEQLAQHPNAKVCPDQTPYSDGEKCFGCEKPKQFFNYKKNECEGCDEGKFYKDGKCQDKAAVTNVEAFKNYLEVAPDYTMEKIINDIEQTKKTKQINECPEKEPYFDQENKKCLGCNEENSYLNLKTKKCEICANYDDSTHICKPVISGFVNLSNPYWIINTGQVDKVLQIRNQEKAVEGAQQCPKGSQFYNKKQKKCVGCLSNTYFNFDDEQCQQCPTQTKFDINLHKCIVPAQKNAFQTNPDSDNVIYGGYPYNQYKDQYLENMNKYPEMQNCPDQKPFYDDVACIQCPKSGPYFNMKAKLCQKCPIGSKYNTTKKECLSIEGTTVKATPNPEKMYANIF